MTGCGKTTVGKLAARLLSVEFSDIDEEIVQKTGKSIKELFSLYGEEGFRRIEHDCLAEKLEEEGFRIVSWRRRRRFAGGKPCASAAKGGHRVDPPGAGKGA